MSSEETLLGIRKDRTSTEPVVDPFGELLLGEGGESETRTSGGHKAIEARMAEGSVFEGDPDWNFSEPEPTLPLNSPPEEPEGIDSSIPELPTKPSASKPRSRGRLKALLSRFRWEKRPKPERSPRKEWFSLESLAPARDLLLVMGFGLAVAGVWIWNLSFGLIVLGIGVMYLAYLLGK